MHEILQVIFVLQGILFFESKTVNFAFFKLLKKAIFSHPATERYLYQLQYFSVNSIRIKHFIN